MGITNSANLTAARTLNINVNDADRTISLSGNLTVSSAATISGTNTGDQTITLTGDVTGSGTGSFAATLANSGATAGTYRSVTVDVKGRVTAGTNPTTLSGYGITDALSNSTTSTQSGYFGDIFLYDDSTPSHYLQITNSANLTAARSLSINVNDANRTVSLSGNLTLANNFTTAGNFAITLTATNTTSVTLPSSGTLVNSADLAGVAGTVTALNSAVISYELDDISTAVDGIENTFVPTFNYDRVSITDPFKLLITVNGIIQSAFVFNTDYVHLTHCLAAKNGYTIDQDGNIKFTESVPMNSDIVARLNGSSTHSTYRYYPFSALDIMLYK